MSGADSKVYGANTGPTLGRQDPGGPHVGPMDLAICQALVEFCSDRFKQGVNLTPLLECKFFTNVMFHMQTSYV